MIEKWRWVRKYKGIYKVSTKGRVKSVDRIVPGKNKTTRLIRGRMIAIQANVRTGQAQVNLYKNNKGRHYLVGRLVLTAFVGPCPEGMECCHFPDADQMNNQLTNLRWGTSNENKADMLKHGTRPQGAAVAGAVLDEEKVKEIKMALKNDIMWGRRARLARKYKVHQNTIRDIDLGVTWSHV